MGLEDVINGVPVFGHAKAGWHVLTGNRYEAGRAFKAANRSTAVMAGGAAGALVGGPMGMVGGAMAAGTACDAASSIANKQAEGVFDGLKDVATDIGNGQLPVKSVLKTGLYVGADAISGATGGSIAGNIPKEMGKSLLKDAAIVVAKSTTKAMVATAATGNATREVAKTIEHDKPSSSRGSSGSSSSTSKSNSSSSSTSTRNTSSSTNTSTRTQSNSGTTNQNQGTTNQNKGGNSGTTNQNKGGNSGTSNQNKGGGSSGGQPPQNNKNNSKTEHEIDESELSHFEVLCNKFEVTSLDDIVIAGVHIFKEITSGKSTDRARKNSLKKLIQALREDGILGRVIEAVKNIFKQLDRSEVTFQNFMYITEMVASHVNERLARRHEIQISRDPRPRIPFHQRRAENLRIILAEIMDPNNANSILNIFRALRDRITMLWMTFQPTFANIITAVTHYFKHKFVPHSFRVLTATEFFQLVQSMLSKVMNSTQYSELKSRTRRRLVYDQYRSEFGRRVRIVLQVQNDVVVISSCHILDIIVIFDDRDGNEEYDPTY